MTCPSCSRSIPNDQISCPSCGTVIVDTATPTKIEPDTGAPPSSPIREGGLISGSILNGRYRIVSLLGKGGMGEVYKAEDLKLDQTVALKFLPEAIQLDARILARFHNEVRVARQVAHPNVCRVYDIGEFEGRPFLSMEFIDGEDLASLLRRIGRLPGDKAVEIARQLCAGLAAAHNVGVLHRDLKPANVMIDGRGKTRVTDFGLAVVSEQLRGDDAMAGTPAYMAPEQLKGKEVNQLSEIYSLGLVLYEIFTGKRVYEATSIHELMQLHEKSTPTTPSSHVKNIDPLAERVIMRCLAKDPKSRPASAMQVALALPGGDPLQAALALGETPSPEMVAAAGEKTGLRPAIGIACMAFVIASLVFLALVVSKGDAASQVVRANSPETLAHKASEIKAALGYSGTATDSAFGMTTWSEYLRYVDRTGGPGKGWSRLLRREPAPVRFWYRDSPRYLEVTRYFGAGWVTEIDPPQDITGMVTIRLDPQGRLLSFSAVPPQFDESRDAAPTPDWTPLFAAAGLEPARFTATDPNWTSLAACDVRAAWTGTYPYNSEIALRVEAAAYRGKPVYFQLIWPWTERERMQQRVWSTGQFIQAAIGLGLIVFPLLGAVLLARYNLSRGRGDRLGAFRLAVFVFAVSMLGWVFGASHTPTQAEVRAFFYVAVGSSLLAGCALWLIYLALEPYVRRRWPHTMISWSRVLSGRLRDPLVGRDVLIGVVFGLCLLLITGMENLMRNWRGALSPQVFSMEAWLRPRYLISLGLLNAIILTLLEVLFLFLVVSLLRALTGREWLAATLFVLILIAGNVAGSANPVISATMALTWFGLWVTQLLRFGLLSVTIATFVYESLSYLPFTPHLSAWYAGTMLTGFLGVLALAGYGFHTSLAGQKVFKGELLED